MVSPSLYKGLRHAAVLTAVFHTFPFDSLFLSPVITPISSAYTTGFIEFAADCEATTLQMPCPSEAPLCVVDARNAVETATDGCHTTKLLGAQPTCRFHCHSPC